MKCENCGNDYSKPFKVMMPGQGEHVFDSFECAINVLAPKCAHCGTKIIGHGLQSGETMYCCAHCAQASGVQGLRDHAQ